jgi:multiple sugar transport system permease protein
MQSIDPGLYEAAIVDGASAWQQIRFLTLPALRNLFLTLGIFDLITTAAYFDLTWIMTQGGPINSTEILPTWIYREAFLSFEFGKAAAIGMILLSVSIFITIFVLRAIEKE